MWKELLIHSPCSHEYSNYSSSKTRSKFDDIQYGSAGKSGASGAFRSSPAERSLRSSGCLQTLITSANGGPFLNRDDANIYIYIDACRHLIPGRRRRRVVQPQPLLSLAPSSFWTSFQRRLSRQIYQPPVFRPVETPWKRI